jgi:hypothetical protein
MDEPGTVKDRQKRKEILKKRKRSVLVVEPTGATSDGSRRGFLPLRRWHDACYHYPPSGFWGVLVVEKESLHWQRSEGKRLGEKLGAPTVLFIGVAKDCGPGSWCIFREIWKVERFP